MAQTKEITINGRKWSKAEVKHEILHCDLALERALLLVYSFQTADEQATDSTHVHNGKGFNSFDAEILSSFAKQMLDKDLHVYPEGRRLSERQREVARRKMQYYSGQVFNYIIAKHAQKEVA